MNCWESKKCGREAKGSKAAELGVCPAYTKNAGQACWMVTGTFCDDEVQGTFAKKEHNCMNCDFYQQFDVAHLATMNRKFGA
jgi:hypothetical protein